MAYTVRLTSDRKIYEDGENKLAVWLLEDCLKRLRLARQNDPMLVEAANKAADFYEKHKNSDDMTKAWNEDCRKIWMKAYDQVLEEAPPETPKKKSLFNKEQ